MSGAKNRTTKITRKVKTLLDPDAGVVARLAAGALGSRWRARTGSPHRRRSARVNNTVKDGPALLGNNYAEARYEDLLENPEGELGRLLEFLGAGASKQIVNRCAGAATFEKLSGG